ncbi:(-)-isopiperitenol/(-)-carveol dehydrogenase, mitochondrial [Morus notabilis]|uniref:(-)-isopiperitenol/(-)-carveol dehydrogenase, mitochondrial n=1 Tax=Morus notabilis TaxID=981085 RepID=UPI000CED3FE5|nr:(-)-isopiperitenol/(-)-carveol dehydrogenase, mitochondrial [Morus notabilis]
MADNSTPTISAGKLHSKVTIVTGGASGIGEATARRFANHGARAVVIADVQDEKGREVAASIGLHRCAYVHCDVSDEAQVKSLVDHTVRTYGRLDVMFSNAGTASESEQTVLDLDISALDRLFAVSTRGMAACVKHAARAMVEGGIRGSVVCTASTFGRLGSDKLTDYTMSKHAVVGLVRSASLQLGKYGIRVNAVSPGPIMTPMLRKVFGEGPGVEKLVDAMVSLKGGGRLAAESVADAVVFLGSDESEFVTGHDLAVDGGFIQQQLEV